MLPTTQKHRHQHTGTGWLWAIMLAVCCIIGMLHAADAQAIALKDYSSEAMILDESMDISLPLSQRGIGKIKHKYSFHLRPSSDDSTPDMVLSPAWQLTHYRIERSVVSIAPCITSCHSRHQFARAPPVA